MNIIQITGKSLLLLVGLIGALSYSKNDSQIVYNHNCKKKWVDIIVYPDTTTHIPQSLTSLDGCYYEKVYFHNKDRRMEWFSLSEQEQQMFRVQGEVKGEVLTIHKIFHDTKDKQKEVTLYVSSNLINDEGCISTQVENYCFKNKFKQPSFPAEPFPIKATVDTEGNILTYREIGGKTDY